MKNLFTLLLLVISPLAIGQTNNTSEEIKYWKSIADSNDTVAYRQYLNRYGETGLYKDEAITRIILLKTSGKQAQSKSVECCFYSRYIGPTVYTDPKSVEYIVRFDDNQDKIWLKYSKYDTIRSNLSISKDFYESQVTTVLSRGSISLMTHSPISGNITDDDNSTLSGVSVVATHTPSGVQYGTETNASGNYYLCNIRPGGPYTIEYRKVGFKTVKQKGVTVTLGKTKILNVLMNEITGEVSIAADAFSPGDYKNAWTVDDEYEYTPMKSTSERDVYFRRGKSNVYDHRSETTITMQGYRYIAFSKDKSSFIMWFEEDDNLDGQIFEKRNYYRVSKEELLPKAVNYDFLND